MSFWRRNEGTGQGVQLGALFFHCSHPEISSPEQGQFNSLLCPRIITQGLAVKHAPQGKGAEGCCLWLQDFPVQS